MKMNTSNLLEEVRAPWLLYVRRKNVKWDLPNGFVELRLDSQKLRNLDDFYHEASLVFQLPDYFGHNLDALDECLTDLEWLPGQGYLVIFKNAESFLCDESNDIIEGILSVFHDAGSEWANEVREGETWDRKAKPFHTVFEFSEDSGGVWLQKIDRTEIAIYELELESNA